jgi:hypothetical protein
MGRDQNGFSQVSVIVAKRLHAQLTYLGVSNGNGKHSGFKSPLSQLSHYQNKKKKIFVGYHLIIHLKEMLLFLSFLMFWTLCYDLNFFTCTVLSQLLHIHHVFYFGKGGGGIIEAQFH